MRHNKSNYVDHGLLRNSPMVSWPGITVGTPEWFDWLKQDHIVQFHYEDTTASYTGKKEWRGESSFWYAFTRVGCKVRKTYLGKSENLTFDVLHKAAQHFSELAIG